MIKLIRNKIKAAVTKFKKRRCYILIAVRTIDGSKFAFSIPVKRDSELFKLADIFERYKDTLEVSYSIKDI